MSRQDAAIRSLSRRLDDLRDQVARGGRASQAGQRSVEDGDTVVHYDADGTVRQLVGAQPDEPGVYTTTEHNGPTPPTPSDPIITSAPGTVTVTWDGADNLDQIDWPSDFARVEVHRLESPDDPPTDLNQLGTFPSPQGGTLTFALPEGTSTLVALVAATRSGAESPPSTVVTATSGITPHTPEVDPGDTYPNAPTVAPTVSTRLGVIRVDYTGHGPGDVPDDFGHWEVLANVYGADDPVIVGTNSTPGDGTIYYVGAYNAPTNFQYREVNKWGRPSETSPASATISAAPVVNTDVIAGTLSGVALAAGTVNAAVALVAGSITAGQLHDDAVTSAAIAANAVSVSELAANAVTNPAIAASAVTSTSIGPNAVTTPAINAGAVVTASLAALAVTTGTLAANAVTTGKITALAVTSGTLAANAVVAGKIDALAVTAGTIAANAVTATTLAANAVTAGTIAANAVTTATIAAGAVTATTIATGAVIAGKIDALAVTAGTIAANAVTTGTIAAGVVTAVQIAVGAITADRLTITNTSQNALLNGSFEDGLGGWELSTGSVGTLTLSTTQASSGVNSAQVTQGATGVAQLQPTLANYVPVTELDYWTFRCRVRGNGTALPGGVFAFVRWFGVDKTTIIRSDTLATIDVPASTWATAENQKQAPTGARYARVELQVVAHNSTVFVDEVTMTRAVTGVSLVGGAVDGQTITGALVRSAATGARYELDAASFRFYSGITGETPGKITPGYDTGAVGASVGFTSGYTPAHTGESAFFLSSYDPFTGAPSATFNGARTVYVGVPGSGVAADVQATGNVSALGQISGTTAYVSGVATLGQPAQLNGASWVTPTLASPFTALTGRTPQYRKDAAGNVHLRGVVNRNSAATGAVAFTLPAGFRPTTVVSVSASCSPAAAIATMNVGTDGTVQFNTLSGTPATYAVDVVFSTF